MVMSSVAGRDLVGEGQIAAETSPDVDEHTERDHISTLDTLNGQTGYRWRWFAQPSMPALRSDLNSPQLASARDSDASKSTWSNVSSYIGSRIASAATTPPTSADYANTFGSTAPPRLHSGPTPPPVSRFSTSSAEFLDSTAQPLLQDDDTPQTVHQESAIYDLVQEKVKSIPFRKIFSRRWGKQAQAAELEDDHKVEKERDANRQVLLRPSAEDRLAMAIIAAKDPTQHALFDDTSTQFPTTPTSRHEGPQNGLLDTPATTEGSDFLGDSFSPESVSPRRSKQRASYQSVQSCASHDSTSTGLRPSDTHPDPYQSGISIYLPGSKGTRWVYTDARFDSQSDDSHISPSELRELGIDVSLDLTVSRALQRLGIMIPRNLVAPTSYSAMGSSGGIVPAQGRIKLTWKAHMGRGYHTNDFFVGPDSAPYGVLIGKDFLVPATGEPRMKLSLPNYRNRKDEDERREAERTRRRYKRDVAENEKDKQLYTASQHLSGIPLAGPSMQQQTGPPSQPYPGYQQLPPQTQPLMQPSAYQQHFPSAPNHLYHQSQYPLTSPQAPLSSQPPFNAQLQPHSPQQQSYPPLSNPLWAQQQPNSPQPHTPWPHYPSAQQHPIASQRQPPTPSSYHPSAQQPSYPRSPPQNNTTNWSPSGPWI